MQAKDRQKHDWPASCWLAVYAVQLGQLRWRVLKCSEPPPIVGDSWVASAGRYSATWNNISCYAGRGWVGETEGTGRGRSPPRPLLSVPNVTAYPSTANVPITVLLLVCGFNVPIKGLMSLLFRQHSLLALRRLTFNTPALMMFVTTHLTVKHITLDGVDSSGSRFKYFSQNAGVIGNCWHASRWFYQIRIFLTICCLCNAMQCMDRI